MADVLRKRGWLGGSVLVVAGLLTVAAAPARRDTGPHAREPRALAKQPVAAGRITVTLASQPGTVLDRSARQMLVQDMADSSRVQRMLVLVGSAQLGSAGTSPALFVQVQSAGECGSAGCSTSVYLGNRKVLDSVSGTIVADTQQHGGMRDLLVGDGERYVWNGTAYSNLKPAPAVNLHPRRRHR